MATIVLRQSLVDFVDSWCPPAITRRLRLLSAMRRKYSRLAWLIGTRLRWQVASGPFRGMKYMPFSYGSRLIPKLLGCYEAALHPLIEEVKARSPRVVIDIGCAEGYYAVGLCRSLPGARVIAFDSSHEAREACRRLADANGLSDRIEVFGSCDARSLTAVELSSAVVICDCEGAEVEIFTPEVISALGGSVVIVELHDFIRPCTEQLKQRFAATHTAEIVTEITPAVDRLEVLRAFSAQSTRLAVDEDRNHNGARTAGVWGVFRPRN
jgi:precorrin-6B methylase 2